jgi:hypothetical protein
MHLLKKIANSLLGAFASIKEASEGLLFKFGYLFCHIVVLDNMKNSFASGKNMNLNSKMLGSWCDKSLKF